MGFLSHEKDGAWEQIASDLDGATTFLDVWGSAPDDVYFVGNDTGWTCVVLHWDGATLTSSRYGGYGCRAVWGSGPDDVWASSFFALANHWNGTSWTTLEAPGLELITGVSGTGPDDVWFVGPTMIMHMP
jgi:hypothetical protein